MLYSLPLNEYRGGAVEKPTFSVFVHDTVHQSRLLVGRELLLFTMHYCKHQKKNCSSNSLFFTLQLNTLIRGHFHPLMDFLNSAISRLLTSVASYSTEYCSTTVWRTGCSGSRPGGLVTSIPFFTSLVAVVVVVESRNVRARAYKHCNTRGNCYSTNTVYRRVCALLQR